MILRQLQIANYKSFFEEVTFEFQPGFNVLLGANSSGKSSVLEAIDIGAFQNVPHRSTLNIVKPDTQWIEQSKACISMDVTALELQEELVGVELLEVGIGEAPNQFMSNNLQTMNSMLQKNGLRLEFRRDHNSDTFGRLRFNEWNATWRGFGTHTNFPSARLRLATSEFTEIANSGGGPGSLSTLWSAAVRRIYRFAADRRVEATSGHHFGGILLPNCSNLAYCINWLQSSNPNLSERLNQLLHRVFPSVHLVAAPPNASNQFELKVHTVPSRHNRGDLAVSISQVGTGVFNATAMLYVALTSQSQRFLLLEEPNSFLHPRALRELLAILAEIGGMHQFFVTTHSSDVLRAVDASTVTLLEHDGQKSTAKQCVGKNISELRSGLIDVGIRLTDLHGCDSVLWVEGETEEAVFPILLRFFFPERAQGIAVLPLHATGDFESKKVSPAKIAEIYKKLSQSNFLAPPMIGIALDRERKSRNLVEQIENDCAGVVRFLLRPMLENYLLVPGAIVDVLNSSYSKQLTPTQVTSALATASAEVHNRLHPPPSTDTTIHAARVLTAVFQELGGAGATYEKTSHAPMLATWIIKNAPDEFEELTSWLGRFLS